MVISHPNRWVHVVFIQSVMNCMVFHYGLIPKLTNAGLILGKTFNQAEMVCQLFDSFASSLVIVFFCFVRSGSRGCVCVWRLCLITIQENMFSFKTRCSDKSGCTCTTYELYSMHAMRDAIRLINNPCDESLHGRLAPMSSKLLGICLRWILWLDPVDNMPVIVIFATKLHVHKLWVLPNPRF